MKSLQDRAVEALNKYYGYSDFRKSQKRVIENILNGKDTLAIMPTGGGKSICYQIPALLFDGITIVISPLISLMKDQVDGIKDLGISAAYINSTLSKNDTSEILDKLKDNEIKILYIAPERLESSEFLNLVKQLNISQVAVDEAHCVSQWGHDFRTSYRYISNFIMQLSQKPVVTAFTATATKEVREDIVRLIKLKNPGIFISGFDRENLKISSLKVGDRFDYLLNYIKENEEQSGIIYVSTRKEADNIYEKLSRHNINITRYHAGLSDQERKDNQEDFVYDRKNVIVATNAFGMGIDKSNVRYVIHYNIPRSIEAYYQEIGRAGRDGEISECILLFAPQDVMTHKYLIETSVQDEERKVNEYKKLQYMIDFVHYSGCLRKYILNYFGEEVAYNECNNCSNCLSEGEYVDRTIDAQKVLSCIFRMKREFGVNVIADVLRGSSQKKVMQYGFNELPTYGIMKDYSKDELSGFINTLIAHGYIDLKEGGYPMVVLNQMSMNVLKNEEKVVIKQNIKVKKLNTNNDLFEILRNVRKEIAAAENVPPYFIFSDNTLKDMSTRYPVTEEQFLDISGVGESKLEKYGQAFISEIKQYVQDKNIDTQWEYKKKSRINVQNDDSDHQDHDVLKKNISSNEQENQIKQEVLRTHEITANMIKQGMSIKQIVEERKLTMKTIISHISKCFEEGKYLDLENEYDKFFNEEDEKLVIESVKKVGIERLAPIKEMLPDHISYDAIRLIIIKNFFGKGSMTDKSEYSSAKTI